MGASGWQEAQAQLGRTAGGSAHAGMEFYRPIEGYPGATTSLGRHTANGGATPAQQVARPTLLRMLHVLERLTAAFKRLAATFIFTHAKTISKQHHLE